MFDRSYKGSVSLFKAQKTHLARIHSISSQGEKPEDRIVVNFDRPQEDKCGTAILDGAVAAQFRTQIRAENNGALDLHWSKHYLMELTGRWGRAGRRDIVFVPSVLGQLRCEEKRPKRCTPDAEGRYLCENCEQHFHEQDIEIAPDPYASDVYGDETPCVLCHDCRAEKVRDI